jgi:hypothetical protein
MSDTNGTTTEAKYDQVYRGNNLQGRKGALCRRIASTTGTYISSIQIEFEDGVQVIVNRNTVRPATLRQVRVPQSVTSFVSTSRKSRT